MATIGSLVSTVASLLGGRTDLNTKISGWIVDGYRDIAMTIPFETLEDTSEITTVSGFDSYDYPSGARGIKSVSVSLPGIPNSIRPLWKRNIARIDRYPMVPGMPSIWAPFGTQIVVRSVPNGQYVLTVRFWLKPIIQETVNDTELMVPDDWLEIVTYEAQMRGYLDLQEQERAANVRSILYGQGDPRKPGLVKQRLTRIQAESMDVSYGIRPKATRYSWTP